jgi:hypothetical protein
MTQSCKFRDTNTKSPKFGTYITQLYKFSDRHWILLKLIYVICDNDTLEALNQKCPFVNKYKISRVTYDTIL